MRDKEVVSKRCENLSPRIEGSTPRDLLLAFPLALILALLSSTLGLGCSGRATASYILGPTQVLGNTNELRVFLEIDRLVDTGQRHFDVPGQKTIGHKQELLIIDSSGKSSRHVLPSSPDGFDGRTFHPNNSSIFFAEGEFYLLAFESRDYKPTLFMWNGVRFSRCDESVNTRLLEKFRLNGKIIEQEPAIKDLEQKSGWSRIFTSAMIQSDSFEWNGRMVKLGVRSQLDQLVISVQVEGDYEFATNLVYETAPIPLTRSEVKALAREEKPHLR